MRSLPFAVLWAQSAAPGAPSFRTSAAFVGPTTRRTRLRADVRRTCHHIHTCLHAAESPDDGLVGAEEAGIFLDEVSYLNADERLNEDGSLGDDDSSRSPRIRNKTYLAAAEGLISTPTYSIEDRDDSTDEASLLEAARSIQNDNCQDSGGDLHDEVFAEEKTFLEQSEVFRTSLTSLYDEDHESAAAKERRARAEEENEKVLEALLRDIDEMGGKAAPRAEALNPSREKASDDVLRILKRSKQLSTKAGDEAKVRSGAGSFGYDEASIKNNSRRRSGYAERRGRARSIGDNGRNRTMRRAEESVGGIDTSSLFDMPKSGNTYPKQEQPSETRRLTLKGQNNQSTAQIRTARQKRRQIIKQQPARQEAKSPPYRPMSIYERRRKAKMEALIKTTEKIPKLPKKRRRVEKRTVDKTLAKVQPVSPLESEKAQQASREDKGADESSTNDSDWILVRDENTGRSLYWNQKTNEMRRTPK